MTCKIKSTNEPTMDPANPPIAPETNIIVPSTSEGLTWKSLAVPLTPLIAPKLMNIASDRPKDTISVLAFIPIKSNPFSIFDTANPHLSFRTCTHCPKKEPVKNPSLAPIFSPMFLKNSFKVSTTFLNTGDFSAASAPSMTASDVFFKFAIFSKVPVVPLANALAVFNPGTCEVSFVTAFIPAP